MVCPLHRFAATAAADASRSGCRSSRPVHTRDRDDIEHLIVAIVGREMVNFEFINVARDRKIRNRSVDALRLCRADVEWNRLNPVNYPASDVVGSNLPCPRLSSVVR